MLSIPDELLRSQVDFPLPEAGQYGVGNIFLPTEEARRKDCIRVLARQARRLGLRVAGWRLPLPCDAIGLGPYALATQPYIGQVFVTEAGDFDALLSDDGGSPRAGGMNKASRKARKRPNSVDNNPQLSANQFDLRKVRELPLDTRLYVLRKVASMRAKEMFICSLHSKTIVYKGQFKPDQLFHYYKDLCHPNVKASMAICHSRFSTNSFPAWQRAHPYRLVAHNGEINTFDGNRNLLRAREALLRNNPNFAGIPIDAIFPIDEDIGSDTALLDNMLELLAHGGRDLAEAVMMVIPEAWHKDPTMPEEKRAFYELRQKIQNLIA